MHMPSIKYAHDGSGRGGEGGGVWGGGGRGGRGGGRGGGPGGGGGGNVQKPDLITRLKVDQPMRHR